MVINKIKIGRIDQSNIAIAALIISTLAFHDQTKLMVITQLLTFIVIVVNCWKCTVTRYFKKYVIWEIFFVFFCALSYFWAINTTTLVSYVISIFQIIMFGTTLILYTKSEKQITNITNYIITSCVILIFRLIVTVPVSAWGSGTRIGQYLGSGQSGGYGNTNLTYVLSLGAIFALFKGIESKKKKYYILVATFTLFSMLSGSKKSIILLFITLLLTMILTSKNILKFAKMLLISSISLLVVWYAIMYVDVLYQSVGFRMEIFISYFNGGETDASTLSRSDFLLQGIEMIKNRPILGVGLDGFRYFNLQRAWAENNFIELLADLGIVGFVIYYYFPISIIVKAIKLKMKNYLKCEIVIVLMACLMFIDTTMVSYANDFLNFYLIITYLFLEVSCFQKKGQNEIL